MVATIEIPQPDDWHVHLREGDVLDAVVGFTAQTFRYALVMPNLVPPITSTAAARSYRNRILAAAPDDANDFRPVMALYCSSDVDPSDLRAGVDEGIVFGVKYYPAGATTNSDAGGSSLAEFRPLFEALADQGTRLLVHAESTNPLVDIFQREEAFLNDELAALCAEIPELLVTVEHVSTRAGVDFVVAHRQVAASITPHHLTRDRSSILADCLHPDLYCKPVINSADDREALLDAATSGPGCFFLGTDSAPHPAREKYGPKGKAGIFNAAHGLAVVAEAFQQRGCLDQLESFVSLNGCATYGVETPQHRLLLRRNEHDGPSDDPSTLENSEDRDLLTAAGDHIVHFGGREASLWSVEHLRR